MNGDGEGLVYRGPFVYRKSNGTSSLTLESAARHQISRLSEKYYGISPYAFCNNNPMNFVDPDGKIPDYVWDGASVITGITSFANNIQRGNIREATIDGAGIIFDAFAFFIPGIPGGIGYFRAGKRAFDIANVGINTARLSRELKNFEKASEFGVGTYKTLKKEVIKKYGKNSGLEVHHLIEKRFIDALKINESEIPTIVLTHEEHKKFTAAWRKEIGLNGSNAEIVTETASPEQILDAARKIYEDYPELLKAIESVYK